MQSSRCYYLDLAKVIATFLVIIGHLYSPEYGVRPYVYGFHMPFFFIVSGVFHKSTGKVNWKYYLKSIIWPTFIFIVLAIANRILFYGSSLEVQLKNYTKELLTGEMHHIIWFLLALFWCKVLLDFFLILNKRLLFFFVWVALLFIPTFFRVKLPLAILQGLMAFPFYFLGFKERDIILKQNESPKYCVLTILCLFITVLITKLHGRVSMMNVSFGSLASILYGNDFYSLSTVSKVFMKGIDISLFYLNGIIGSVMILSLSLIPFPKWKGFTALSQSLITVVGTQSLFIEYIKESLGFDNGFLLSALLSIVIFFFCFLIHKILKPVYKVFDK